MSDTTAAGQRAAHAVWAIWCELDPARLTAYLDWFHGVHIPEKLDRPGYVWAAHYRVSERPSSYLALFGGTSTQAFLDPSPAQLKTRQDPVTREMMGIRVRSQNVVLAVEWCVTANGRPGAALAAVDARHVAFAVHDAPGADEALGAWLVQQAMPARRTLAGWRGTAKLLAASGAMRHALLSEFDVAPPPGHCDVAGWSGELRCADGCPLTGERVWPA